MQQELLVGSAAEFTCVGGGDPPPSLVWLDSASIDVQTLGDAAIQVPVCVCLCVCVPVCVCLCVCACVC